MDCTSSTFNLLLVDVD